MCLSMCTIPDYRKVSNSKYIPRKSKKDLFNPKFHFWVFRFYDILTFEYKFDRMHIAIETVEKPQKSDFGASKCLILL